MLTRLEVRTDQGSLLDLPFDDISDGFVVEEIDGLDPVQAVIVSTSFAQQDGEQYQAARRDKRNIVLKLGLEPDYSTSTVRQLRNILYGFFMPKSSVNMRFVSDDEPDVDISGRVESFDAPLFVQDPVATISILCFDPDFVDQAGVHVTGTSVNDLTQQIINYAGTVETGFVFRMNVNRSITTFSLINQGVDGSQQNMEFAASLVSGDTLTVSTISGEKRVTLNRAGVETSLLYSLSPYSPWIQLFPGSNSLRLAISGDTPMPFTLDYTDKYGGL